MTLTRILPTLRRSIPDPIAIDHWPAATTVTTTDVIVGGVSLVRLAELCDSPAVHLGRAVVPGSGGVAAQGGHTGVVVVRVLEASVDGIVRTLTIDADLAPLDPAWREARLIGRTSVARVVPTALVPAATATDAFAPDRGCPAAPMPELPGDVAVGDLIAMPYAAVTADAGVARPASGQRTSRDVAPSAARA